MTDRHVARGGRRLTATVTDLEVVRQRALLLAVAAAGDQTVDASLDELALLTDTAGSDPVARVVQRRDHPHPATLIGAGKVSEVTGIVAAEDIDVVVVDNELTPVQQRNLQQAFKVDVVDRVALILDIFALHATSREGMLQVELAQLRYRLPRLRGKGITLSRQAGGIGTRGPGETQLETDRRRVLDRIAKLERQLTDVAKSRETRRKRRRGSDLPTVALVGYTNAGKSSLLNALTGAEVLVEDRLFSTLDATVRRLELPSGATVLMSDTVGFVKDLPHQLVEAFRSTLEEAVETDLLLHVVDASSDEALDQIAAVESTLADIGAADVPQILVLNKADIATPGRTDRLNNLYPGSVVVSAVAGTGLDELGGEIERRLIPPLRDVVVVVPYDRGDVVAAVHRDGEVLEATHEDAGTRLKARVPEPMLRELMEFTE